MAYSDKVLDHYNHPRNVGSFDKSDPTVGTGMLGAPSSVPTCFVNCAR
jgi:nitrogen fixation NifU-like protein